MKPYLILAALAVMVSPAQARDCVWREQHYACVNVYTGHQKTCTRWRCISRHTHYYGPGREYELTQDRYDRDDRGLCLSVTVDVLSTEHTQEDNAREAARKLWMAKTQWAHGGQYMALENASDVRWRCSASNAHDTVSGRIAEAAGALTGRGGQNVRCALWARPCKAAREKDRDLRR
jgi:hypothetical protein